MAPSSRGVLEPDREILESRGVAADSSPVSSWSSPKESLLFARGFFFFFLGGPSLRGVDDLTIRKYPLVQVSGGTVVE